MTKNEIILTPQRLAELSKPEGIIAFFAELGYGTDLQRSATIDKEMQLRIHRHEEVQRKIKHFQRIAENIDGETSVTLHVYLYVLTSITRKIRDDLAHDLQKRSGHYLLVLTTESQDGTYNELELVYLDPTQAPSMQPELPELAATALPLLSETTTSRLREPLLVDRRHPGRVTLRALRQLAYNRHSVWEQCRVISEAFDIAETSEENFSNHALFSDHYLKHRLRSDVPEWLRTEGLSREQEEMEEAYEQLRRLYSGAASEWSGKPLPELRAALFDRVLSILGFEARPHARREQHYLFAPKNADDTETHVACLAYPWGRTLDDTLENAGEESYAGDPTAGENPAVVVVSLLQEAQWAILTNGKLWRLYCAKARSRATTYYEIDLQEVFAIRRQDAEEALTAFRYFWLFFHKMAFVAKARQDYEQPPYICWLEFMMRESEKYARELGDSLKERIFDDIFPHFAQGLVSYAQQTGRLTRDLAALSAEERAAALQPYFDATLTFLYRLLFLFYAESRDLLPMHDERYSQQSLQSIKKEIAAIAKENEAQAPQLIRNHYSDSHQEVGLYTHLSTLFAAIDRGNPDLNVPTYNGGLFMTVFEQEKLPDLWTAEERVARFLDEHKIPDRYLGTGA